MMTGDDGCYNTVHDCPLSILVSFDTTIRILQIVLFPIKDIIMSQLFSDHSPAPIIPGIIIQSLYWWNLKVASYRPMHAPMQ